MNKITNTSKERYGCVIEEMDTGNFRIKFRIKHVQSNFVSPWASEVCAMVIDDPICAIFAVAEGHDIRIMNPAEYAQFHLACGYSSHQV